MNASDLFVALLFGLSIPLMLSSVLRGIGAGDGGYLTHERRFSAMAVITAILAGPGLLIDRLREDWETGSISQENLLFGVLAAIAWSFLYGFVALSVFVSLSGLS